MTNNLQTEAIHAFHAAFLHTPDAISINKRMANLIGLKETFLLAEVFRLTYAAPDQRSVYADGNYWIQRSFTEINTEYPCLGKRTAVIQLVNKLVEEGLLIKAPAHNENGSTASNLYRINPLAIGERLAIAKQK